jgi:hypothetical protein
VRFGYPPTATSSQESAVPRFPDRNRAEILHVFHSTSITIVPTIELVVVTTMVIVWNPSALKV